MADFNRRSGDKSVTERECDLRHQPLDVNAADVWVAIEKLRDSVSSIYWKVGVIVGVLIAIGHFIDASIHKG